MKNLVKNIGLLLLFFVVISGILVLYSAPKTKPAEISFSALVEEINQSQVKKILVDNEKLEIELQPLQPIAW